LVGSSGRGQAQGQGQRQKSKREESGHAELLLSTGSGLPPKPNSGITEKAATLMPQVRRLLGSAAAERKQGGPVSAKEGACRSMLLRRAVRTTLRRTAGRN